MRIKQTKTNKKNRLNNVIYLQRRSDKSKKRTKTINKRAKIDAAQGRAWRASWRVACQSARAAAARRSPCSSATSSTRRRRHRVATHCALARVTADRYVVNKGQHLCLRTDCRRLCQLLCLFLRYVVRYIYIYIYNPQLLVL
jgi:hypothetical protein